MSDVGNVFQNVGNNMLVPEDSTLFLIVVGYDTTVSFVLPRRRNIHFVELLIDTHVAHTLATPQENLLNDRSRFGVHNKAVLIFGVFQITVLFPSADIFTVLHLGFQSGKDLSGNVLRIEIVDDVGERCRKLRIVCNGFGIVIVVHGNKAETDERTDLFQELTGLNVVSAETREVFYDNAVNITETSRINHTLKFGSHKVCAGEAVVDINGNLTHCRVVCDKVLQIFDLAFDRIRVFSVIFNGETGVNCYIIKFCLLRKRLTERQVLLFAGCSCHSSQPPSSELFCIGVVSAFPSIQELRQIGRRV